MFDDDAPQQISRRSGSQKGKRAKTFTGCWTCRSRKVKCDLKRPNCERCEKSGLECGGYDIKLRWSKPVKFDQCGAQMPNTPVGSMNDEPQYRRRNIDFVRYKEEYQYYEDMDEELTALHKPPHQKVGNGSTWILKKFGVFRGVESSENNPSRQKRPLSSQSKQTNDSESLDLYKADDQLRPFDFLEDDAFLMNFPSTNEWISKELKDDVLISASALQEFPIVGMPLSSSSVTTATPPENQSHHSGIADVDSGIDATPALDQKSDQALQHALQVLFHRQMPSDTATVPMEEYGRGKKNLEAPAQYEMGIECPILGSAMPKAALEIVNSPLPDPKIFNLPDVRDPLLSLPTTGLHVHGLTRFLLNYYIQNVADLMTVVALDTNPWKTLYFPRALQAVGDLAGLGFASNSRNSILNALLAVACFNLNSKFAKKSPEAQFFLNLGIEFRKQASGFLRNCMNTTIKNEKYKDVLTAMLSMNSIDVVWGTMADCQYHLTVCEDFIETRMKERPKISEKAKTLHRLFSFLKLIQDSTALDKVRDKEITIVDNKEMPSSGNDGERTGDKEQSPIQRRAREVTACCAGILTEVLDKTSGKIKMQYPSKDRETRCPLIKSVPNFKDNAGGICSYTDHRNSKSNALNTDDLYGLPKSLVLLFSDCVRLARHNEYFKMKNIPSCREFDVCCSKFEDELMHWSSEWDFWQKDSTSFINNTIEGVYHHTMSFYYGLVVYYFTVVRNLSHQHLQSHVEKVLHHLEALDASIEKKNVKIVPLIWQGFMAGCSSVDGKVQAGFRKWSARLSTNGMGSYWGARQVMLEVWRRRTNETSGDNWYSVYKDWEMNLMLS